MKRIFTFFLLFASFQMIAQNHPSCDGQRFRSDIFEELTVSTGILYGNNTTFGGVEQDLYLDIYEPTGDVAETRPAIILAFGGSFIAGERADMASLCEAYAKKGYVAVTIDYRLYDGPPFQLPTALEMTDVVTKAVGDMRAAVRFLREDAANNNVYRIDPDNIFAGGISAGAITAAHTAVLDENDDFSPELLEILDNNGGFQGNSSENTEYSSDIKGYINFSGGLNNADWIDETDPPFFSVHDDGDQTVPYGSGFASIFGFDIVEIEGSLVMKQVADEVGVYNELHTIEDSDGHVSYLGNSEDFTTYLDLSSEFLFTLICADWTSGLGDLELKEVSIYPNPTNGFVSIKNEQQISLNASLFNMLGQKINDWNNVSTLDLSSFEEGMYFLELKEEGTERKMIEKIIVKN